MFLALPLQATAAIATRSLDLNDSKEQSLHRPLQRQLPAQGPAPCVVQELSNYTAPAPFRQVPRGQMLCKASPGNPSRLPHPHPHPSRLRLKSSELPSPSEVSSCPHLGRWGTGLNLQMPFLRKEDRFLGLKVSNYVYYRRLKIPCTPLLAALTVTRAHS